ncbi:PAS domain-containing protein [Mucilaginibacter sp. PAMB04274]|uniref:PAS domain-containing protein n=1 Tax=Mucilaginibacter sp. PAMB04274 TaxID=3138568 RepID=UPI0031F6FE27
MSSVNFVSLYHHAPCGLLTFDINGTILYANQTLLTWLGKTAEAVIGTKFTDLLEKGGKIYYQLFVHPLLQLKNEVNEVNLYINSARGAMPCLFSASLFTECDTTELVFNATLFKVADRKKYEEELLMKKKQAEAENEAQTATLEEVAFAQSHLVRAPLANILGLISLLEHIDMDEEGKSIVQMVQTSAIQLDKKIRALADKLNS